MAEIGAVHDFRALTERYRLFLLDQYGVLHDGVALYPHVLETLLALRARGAALALVSNSGRGAGENAERMQELGLPPELLDAIVTSGDLALRAAHDFIASQAGRGKGQGEQEQGQQEQGFFLLSPEHDALMLRAEGVPTTARLASATGLYLGGLPSGQDAWLKLEAVMQRALERELTLLCANPDRWIVSRAGGGDTLQTGTGKIAADYEQLGGKVLYFGKPSAVIFDEACAHFPEIARKQTLMIGDMLHTDIAGACAAGIDSLLITSGVHAAAFANLTEHSQRVACTHRLAAGLPQDLRAACGSILPTFLSERLQVGS